MYPHTVTVINQINVKGSLQTYYKELVGVLYQDKQGVRTGDTSVTTDNQGYVQIPKSVGGYLPPKQYAKLTDKSNNWTIKENDFIVKGSHVGIPLDDLDNVRTIVSDEDIDYGIVIPPHYGVYLK